MAARAVEAAREHVAEQAYYAFLERAALPDDHGLPYRYAEALHPDDFSALGRVDIAPMVPMAANNNATGMVIGGRF